MWHWMKQMAQFVGIDKDITNKSRHVTSIKKMIIVQVAPKIMALTIGHMNLKTLGKYDRSIFLKHFVTQVLLQHAYNEETREFLDFDHHCNEQLQVFHKKEILKLATFFLGISTIPCISLIKHVVSMDFDWPPIVSNTFIPILNPSTPLVVELNVPLHQTMDLASNAPK